MSNITIRKKIVLLISHAILGVVLYNYPFVSTYVGLAIVIFGSYKILSSPNHYFTISLYLISYIVGLEVLLRMCEFNLVWEFGKYTVIYFIVLGMIRQNYKINIYPPVAIYFFLLIPSIINLPFYSFNDWRQDIAFNLAGPTCLFFLSSYLYNRRITKDELIKMFFFALLPILSMSIFVILKMPSFASYIFMPYSDPSTSGGYGPNQVSTIFGFIITCLLVIQINRRYLTNSIIDITCIILFTILGLLTFSRGGMVGAIISIVLGISYQLFREQNKMQFFLKTTLLSVISLFIWISVSIMTDNVIKERYNIMGESYGNRLILDLTGRAEIFYTDLQIFKDYLFTGAGPGMAKKLRPIYGFRKIAAHTEYSRMLAEHGVFGLFSLLLVIGIPFKIFLLPDSTKSKTIKIVFGSLALFTMLHTALRIAMPCFIYSLIMPKYDD